MKRSGLVAQKVGMSRVFQEDGSHVPVTVLHVDNCQVVDQRTQERDAIQPFSWVWARPK